MKLEFTFLLDAMPDSSMRTDIKKICFYGLFDFVV